MAGKTRQLNPAQTLAMNELRDATRTLRTQSGELEARIRAQFEAEMASLEILQSLAARKAEMLGVPTSRIGRDGLNTSDWATVKKVIARTDAHAYAQATASGNPFTWLDKAERTITVRYPEFPTSSTTDDYPEILEGVVRLDDDRIVVVSDESDQPSEFGVIPGMLHWEVEFAPQSAPDSLAAMILDWAEANA